MDFPVYPAGHLFGVHPTRARAHGQEGGGRRETVPGTVSWRGEVGWCVEQMQGLVIISAHGKWESGLHRDETSCFCTGASSKDTSALFPTWSDSLKLGNHVPCFPCFSFLCPQWTCWSQVHHHNNNNNKWDFPSCPGVELLPSNAGGASLIPDQGAMIPHAPGPTNQNTKNQKHYCNKFLKNKTTIVTNFSETVLRLYICKLSFPYKPSLMEVLWLALFYRWRSWSSKSLSLPKVPPWWVAGWDLNHP